VDNGYGMEIIAGRCLSDEGVVALPRHCKRVKKEKSFNWNSSKNWALSKTVFWLRNFKIVYRFEVERWKMVAEEARCFVRVIVVT